MKTAVLALAATMLALGPAPIEPAVAADTVAPAPYGATPWPASSSFGAGIPLQGYLWNMAPAPLPRVGCYFTRTRSNGAWLRVEVCY
jgi:hypothetical protein